ncbi:hypothetical protein VTN31DRAFT_235 [Thermomyces dupontii]|uniref:uncharacterized protein n=1 Tax=Talaromyces thermophilus TaxID=28565 RepID=UPI0037420682
MEYLVVSDVMVPGFRRLCVAVGAGIGESRSPCKDESWLAPSLADLGKQLASRSDGLTPAQRTGEVGITSDWPMACPGVFSCRLCQHNLTYLHGLSPKKKVVFNCSIFFPASPRLPYSRATRTIAELKHRFSVSPFSLYFRPATTSGDIRDALCLIQITRRSVWRLFQSSNASVYINIITGSKE